MNNIFNYFRRSKSRLIVDILLVFLFERFLSWAWENGFNIIIHVNEKLSNSFYSSVANDYPHLEIQDYLIVSFCFIAFLEFYNGMLYEFGNGQNISGQENDLNPKQTFKIYKWLKGLRIPILILFGFILFSIYMQDVLLVKENKRFNRSLNIVSPYIEDKEIKILRSKWALMNSRNDYDEIYKYIDSIIKKENLE